MAIPTDTLFSQQWHLQNTVAGLFDLNVTTAWDDYTGNGIRIVVMDNAFDYLHSDIAPNYNTVLDYDYANTDAVPYPSGSLDHGTAVMGIIGADDDGAGVVGVAYDSELIGYQVTNAIGDTMLANFRDGIADAATSANADIINISFGIANDITTVFGNGLSSTILGQVRDSIGTAVSSGRGGLGSIVVKSAGNSRSDGNDANAVSDNYDVNADAWAQDTRQVVVAAVDQDGTVSSYSSYGAANLVSAFGTPNDVVTTDRTGAPGYTNGDFTFFSGTSAAAPMVSGVVALMLEANDDLGWRDVQNILAYSARHVGSQIDGSTTDGIERTPWQWNGAENWNGGGLHFSNDYGYGLVDGLAAVRMAETWTLMGAAQTSANERASFEDGLNSTVTIPDGNASGTSFNINESFNVDIERVKLTVTFSTTYIGDLEIYLTSPDGTTSELIRDIVQGNDPQSNDFTGTWAFESQAFRGESSVGNWTVRIVDDAGRDTLTVSDIDLQTFGSAPSVNNDYIFTNEYSDFASGPDHDTVITDTNGGLDFVNAAAVTSSSTINLNGGASVIDGVALTLRNIENAIAGDGNDTLIGNATTNWLYGMRGNDSLNGGGGADVMRGGDGDDIYHFDQVGDQAIENANEGFDTVFSGVPVALRPNIEAFVATGSANMSVAGNNGNNFIYGNTGNNYIEGAGGLDNMYGGLGDDIYVFSDLGDAAFENVGEGFDTVFASIGMGLSANSSIEALVLTGTANNAAFGNNLSNFVYGNSGNNYLDGGAGVDAMYGRQGNDIFVVHDFGDQAIEEANQGFDTVFSDISFALGVHVEALQLNGSANINATGNAMSNFLYGNSGANRIDGGGGADALTGNGGLDTFIFRAGQINGDSIADFFGNGSGAGDRLEFHGFGAGASLAQISATQWQVTYNSGASQETLTFSNAAAIDASDYMFV